MTHIAKDFDRMESLPLSQTVEDNEGCCCNDEQQVDDHHPAQFPALCEDGAWRWMCYECFGEELWPELDKVLKNA